MAVALGADAVGSSSPPVPARSLRESCATSCADSLPRRSPSGSSATRARRFVIETTQAAQLRGVQLHGHETAAEATRIRPYCQALIVAFPAGDPGLAHVDDYGADAVLLDSHAPGSGQVFDWSLAEGAPANRRLILAGGLDPDNVAAGIAEVRPWGVDVASGVEVDGQPGRKDPLKVQAFIHAARAAAASGAPAAVPDDVGPFDWAESGL